MRHTRFLRTTALALALALASPLGAQPGGAASAIKIPFERVTLPNGLNVLLAPDHSTPRVTVDVWYHVGSKNEVPGRTGFAHMFEHVMFTGSGHVPYGTHDRLTEGVGGDNNGSTTNDRTNYYENVPSNYLEDQLWMESDRMGFLLDKLDEASSSPSATSCRTSGANAPTTSRTAARSRSSRRRCSRRRTRTRGRSSATWPTSSRRPSTT
jgi:zinc protease